MKIHIKCSEFGWVKNVTEERRGGGGIPFYRVGIYYIRITNAGPAEDEQGEMMPLDAGKLSFAALGFRSQKLTMVK